MVALKSNRLIERVGSTCKVSMLIHPVVELQLKYQCPLLAEGGSCAQADLMG